MYFIHPARICSVVTAFLFFAAPCFARGEWPDGPHKEWFENLRRPDNHLHPERDVDVKSQYCCGAADVVKTRFKVEMAGGEYPERFLVRLVGRFMDENPAREDRRGLRPEWTALPFHAGRHDTVLCAAQGRPLSRGQPRCSGDDPFAASTTSLRS